MIMSTCSVSFFFSLLSYACASHATLPTAEALLNNEIVWLKKVKVSVYIQLRNFVTIAFCSETSTFVECCSGSCVISGKRFEYRRSSRRGSSSGGSFGSHERVAHIPATGEKVPHWFRERRQQSHQGWLVPAFLRIVTVQCQIKVCKVLKDVMASDKNCLKFCSVLGIWISVSISRGLMVVVFIFLHRKWSRISSSQPAR